MNGPPTGQLNSSSPSSVGSRALPFLSPPRSMPPATPTSTAKRKKWTEEEERALISKYSELQSSGALSRLRTRERKFRPIADHVTAAHHGVDPTAYPFSWSWKDACTKAHNMRHQYLLVKQKLLSAAASAAHHGPDSSGDVSWADGLSLWPNFLRYKEVFGDAPLPTKPLDDLADLGFDDDEEEGDGGGGEGFDCDAAVDVGPAATAEDEERPKKMKSKKKKKKKKRKVRVWEEEEEEEEREWEERMERRRAEWRKRVEEMLGHHRLQMAQIQARVLNEQQAVIGQLLGLVSHWAGGGGGGGGGVGGSGYGANVNGVAVTPGENRVGVGSGDGQEEQFILDG